MAFKFMHMADCHLDTPFVGKESMAAAYRNDLRTAFIRAIDAAITNDVNAVLIAGDLFDNENLSYATLSMVNEQFSRLLNQGIAVLYVTGNHDSQSNRAFAFPDGVLVFQDVIPQEVHILNKQEQTIGVVMAAGYGAGNVIQQQNAAAEFPVRDSGLPTVGLVHAQVTPNRYFDGYRYCSLNDLIGKGYDYWALGHVHAAQELANGSVVYSGCICGRDYGEVGSKGVYIVEISGARTVTKSFIPVSPIEFSDVSLVNVTDIDTLDELADAAVREVRRQYHMTRVDAIARVTIMGQSPFYEQLTGTMQQDNLEYLSARISDNIKARLVEVRVQDLVRIIDPDQWRNQPHVLGETLEAVQCAVTQDQYLDELLEEASNTVALWGIQGMNKEDARSYARDLLNNIDDLICSVMVKE